MRIASIRVDNVTIEELEEDFIYIQDTTVLSYEDVHSLLKGLGLLGFDLRGYTTQETIDGVGE